METVNILFRLIVKIVTVEGVACRAHPHLDPVQGGSGVSMQSLPLCVRPD